MPAFNEKEVLEQIQNFKDLAAKLVAVQNQVRQVLENKEVLTQNWNDLATDFPALVDGVTKDDPVLVGGTEQDFSPNHLNQFQSEIQKIQDFFDGTAITVTGNPGRKIRRLTNGVV